MTEIIHEKPQPDKISVTITIDLDEERQLEKIHLSYWEGITPQERITVFSKLVNDLHMWVNLDEFKATQITYQLKEQERKLNRQIQTDIKESWGKRKARPLL